MTSAAASIAGGVLDSISAGILIYAATVELMVSPAHSCAQWYGGLRADRPIAGTRVRLQPVLPYVLLETAVVRHHMLCARCGTHVSFG